MQLNLHRLWIFMQVVECGGFSAAAQQLYMSQPSVSNQVRQLERSLHTTLIDRSGARIRPTAEGDVLMGYAREIFKLADEAVAAIQQLSGVQAGRLVVGGTATVGTYLLPDLLADFRQHYPGIECDLFIGTGAQVLKQLTDGEIGLAMLTDSPSDSHLVTTPVLSERLLLVSAPDHRLAGKTVRPDDLAGERFVLRERGSSTREEAEAALASWRLRAIATHEVWGAEALAQAVADGEGIAPVSEHAVHDDLGNGRLVTIDVDPPLPTRDVVLAHRRDRLLAPAETAFLTHVTK